MIKLPRLVRHQEIGRIRSDLERNSFPRIQMFLLVAITGASGFAASYLLLHAGLLEMWIRYLASFCVAYLAFLCLLWLWLRTQAQDYADIPDVIPDALSGSSSPSSCGPSPFHSGKGGDFGGGGASASFDGPSDGITGLGESGGSVGDALGAAAEAEELAIPLIALVLLGALIFSSLFMVSSAPVLFAELLVDGVLSASLYRRLRGLETRHWLETAVRRTALPFILTAIVVSASGWGMKLYAPEAHTLGQVILHSKQFRSN